MCMMLGQSSLYPLCCTNTQLNVTVAQVALKPRGAEATEAATKASVLVGRVMNGQ